MNEPHISVGIANVALPKVDAPPINIGVIRISISHEMGGQDTAILLKPEHARAVAKMLTNLADDIEPTLKGIIP